MLKKLKKLSNQSFSPFSNLKVSCIIIDNYNNQFRGINIENSSYGATICAERIAIGNLLIKQGKYSKICKIYLYNNTDKIIVPCGICLQSLQPFITNDVEIISYSNINKKSWTYKELFPNPFSLN